VTQAAIDTADDNTEGMAGRIAGSAGIGAGIGGTLGLVGIF
jgi:hypothetical protein